MDGAKCNGRSRPSDKKVGGGASKKKVFLRPFGPQFGLKIKGGGVGHQGPSPGSATEMQLYATLLLCLVCARWSKIL